MKKKNVKFLIFFFREINLLQKGQGIAKGSWAKIFAVLVFR